MALIREVATQPRQTALHDEAIRLFRKIGKTNGREAPRLAARLDDLIQEAANMKSVNTPSEAANALDMALCAMGIDCKHPSPEERLIQLAARFLRTLVVCLVASCMLLAPAISSGGLVAGRFSGIV